MDPTESRDSATTAALRNYRRSFATLREEVRKVQQLSAGPTPDRAAIDAAVLEMEKAWQDYRSARDILLRQMMPAKYNRLARSSNASIENEVKHIAELLWELEGKRDGDALDDWYRAETIVRRTSPAVVGQA
jgi:hypothetical protein